MYLETRVNRKHYLALSQDLHGFHVIRKRPKAENHQLIGGKFIFVYLFIFFEAA